MSRTEQSCNSKMFEVNDGLKQGGFWGPALFLLIVDDIIRDTER